MGGSISDRCVQERVALTSWLLDSTGLLRPLDSVDWIGVENCTITTQGVLPTSAGPFTIEQIWNGITEDIELLALDLRQMNRGFIGLEASENIMPLDLGFYVENSSSALRYHWLPGETWDWDSVAAYEGPWEESFEAKLMALSNRNPVPCTLLVQNSSGVCFWIEETYKLQFEAGIGIILDATEIDGSKNGQWEQVFGNAHIWEYISSNQVSVRDLGSGRGTFSAQWPGVYRFKYGLTFVDVFITLSDHRMLSPLCLVFPDYYGEWGGAQFRASDDETFSWAAEYAQNLNADSISIINVGQYTEVDPLPSISFVDLGFSLNEEELARLAAAGAYKSLGFMLQEQIYSYPFLTGLPDIGIISESLGTRSERWWKQWFGEIETFLLEQARQAEALGMEYFMLMYNPEPSLQFAEEWRGIILRVRQEFSGAIGLMTYASSPDSVTFYDALDFYAPHLSTLGGGFPTKPLSQAASPSIQEVRERIRTYFAEIRTALGRFADTIEVFPVLNVASIDGQNGFTFAEPLPSSEMDLQEQVIYYESFFQEIYATPWVDGLMIRGPSWFTNHDFPEDYFDSYSNVLFTSKPAEEVVKIWLEVLGAP